MLRFALEFYGELSAFATMAYIYLGTANSVRPFSDELELMREFDEVVGFRQPGLSRDCARGVVFPPPAQ